MRRVELLGMPGSGKSTLAATLAGVTRGALSLDEAVLSALRHHGADALTRSIARITGSTSSRTWRRAYHRSSDRSSALARFMAASPQTLETFIRVQALRAERDLAPELALGWMQGFLSRFQIATEHPEVAPVLVIDEGFRQRSVSLVGAGYREQSDLELLHQFLTACPTTDLVILVDTPFDVCLSRLEARGWSKRVEGLGPEGRQEFLEGCTRVVAAVADHQRDIGVTVAEVDGSTTPDPEALADLIVPQGT